MRVFLKAMIVPTMALSLGIALFGPQAAEARSQALAMDAQRVNPYESPPNEYGGCASGNLVTRGGRDVRVVCPQSIPDDENEGMCLQCPPYRTMNRDGTCPKN